MPDALARLLGAQRLDAADTDRPPLYSRMRGIDAVTAAPVQLSLGQAAVAVGKAQEALDRLLESPDGGWATVEEKKSDVSKRQRKKDVKTSSVPCIAVSASCSAALPAPPASGLLTMPVWPRSWWQNTITSQSSPPR